jgi:hypothetical protein
MQTLILDEEPCLFLDLALDTLLGRFPSREFSTQTVPLACMDVVRPFVAMFQI